MDQPDLTQARAIPLSDEEKDRQIAEVVALLERQSAYGPAWSLTHGAFMKLIDRPKRQRDTRGVH